MKNILTDVTIDDDNDADPDWRRLERSDVQGYRVAGHGPFALLHRVGALRQLHSAERLLGYRRRQSRERARAERRRGGAEGGGQGEAAAGAREGDRVAAEARGWRRTEGGDLPSKSNSEFVGLPPLLPHSWKLSSLLDVLSYLWQITYNLQ